MARVPIAAGTELRVEGVARGSRRSPFRPATRSRSREIAAGETVLRYGQAIGRATAAIAAGRHVHTHNLSFEELQLDYEFPAGETPVPERRTDGPTSSGYCARGRARGDAQLHRRRGGQQLRGAHRGADRAQLRGRNPAAQRGWRGGLPARRWLRPRPGPDVDQLRRTLGGVLAHPNVSAAVILGLGCEDNQIDHYLGRRAGSGRLAGLTLQASGGTRGTLEAARREIARFIERAAAGEARRGARFANRAGAELRRLGFLLRHHRQSGAGLLLGPAGRAGRHVRCWRRRPRSSAPSTFW